MVTFNYRSLTRVVTPIIKLVTTNSHNKIYIISPFSLFNIFSIFSLLSLFNLFRIFSVLNIFTLITHPIYSIHHSQTIHPINPIHPIHCLLCTPYYLIFSVYCLPPNENMKILSIKPSVRKYDLYL